MDKNVLAIILAGGAGERLKPLTRYRAKPAVPFGGKYRIIDFTLSNCLHSGLRRMLVSASLTLYLNIRTFPDCADGLQLPAILSLPGRETEFVTSLDAVNREKV